jgi:glycosyltransferase involved in cell wall biosynthesis
MQRGRAGVLFGIDSHSAEREGEGNSTYSRNLISALFATGGDDDFALFAGNRDHPFYRSLPSRGRSRIMRIGQGRGLARLAWTLARAASRERVDVLHVQYAGPLGYHGPLVVTVHDLAFLHVPESFPPALRVALRVLVPRSVARASRIITVSEFSCRDIVARYAIRPEKITVIPLGVDARFHPLAVGAATPVLARYGLRPGFLFSLGRLNRRKNLERLLQAYARARAGGAPAVPLVIGGKPDYGIDAVLPGGRPLTESVDGVRWMGPIPDADLPAFYSGAAGFIYPSLFEGFGLPVLEAMACGTPLVTSDRAALPELIGDAGLSVDPENVEVLAEAMTRILTDHALVADLRRRGLERSRRFSWEETAKRTLAVYRDALQSGRG